MAAHHTKDKGDLGTAKAHADLVGHGFVVLFPATEHAAFDLVAYRSGSRWTHLFPTAEAAAVLDPELHAELDGAQVWLLSWLPDQGTPLHDHGTSAGAFAVVRGGLNERVVAVGRDGTHESQLELTAGRIRHFGPHYVHQVTNVRPEPAISVHVYTPGLAWMNTYAIDGSQLVRVGTERAGVDW